MKKKLKNEMLPGFLSFSILLLHDRTLTFTVRNLYDKKIITPDHTSLKIHVFFLRSIFIPWRQTPSTISLQIIYFYLYIFG